MTDDMETAPPTDEHGAPITESTIAELRSEVIALTAAIKDREDRNRWIFGGFVILLLGVAWAAWTALGAADDAQETADALVAERNLSREVACESYNTDTVDRINGILLIAAAGSDDPNANERVAQLLLPHRDCSEEGLDAYFDGDPATDPFVPTELPELQPAPE